MMKIQLLKNNTILLKHSKYILSNGQNIKMKVAFIANIAMGFIGEHGDSNQCPLGLTSISTWVGTIEKISKKFRVSMPSRADFHFYDEFRKTWESMK